MSPEEQAALMFKYEKGEWVQVWAKEMTMGAQEQVVELAALIREARHRVGWKPEDLARAILAAGYERRRDFVAEQDELRKQVRG